MFLRGVPKKGVPSMYEQPTTFFSAPGSFTTPLLLPILELNNLSKIKSSNPNHHTAAGLARVSRLLIPCLCGWFPRLPPTPPGSLNLKHNPLYICTCDFLCSMHAPTQEPATQQPRGEGTRDNPRNRRGIEFRGEGERV